MEHKGIEENEPVDFLSWYAIEKSITCQDKYITHAYFEEKSSRKVIDTWRNIWHAQLVSEEEGRISKRTEEIINKTGQKILCHFQD